MTPVALITGANKGLGLEIARGLGSRGYRILLGARDPERGARAAALLRAEGIEVDVVRIDVDSDDSVRQAADDVARVSGCLDALVNNAGILVDWGPPPSCVDMDLVRRTFETNVFGPIRVTQAMLPHLRKSSAGRVVNMSSGLGSMAWTGDPEHPYGAFALLAYNASKAALNMATIQFANELRATSIKVNAADPGYCDTDLNGHTGQRSPQQGAAIAVTLATLPSDGPTGGFFNDEGAVPW